MHVHCIHHVRVVTCVTRLCHEQWSPAVCVSHGPALSPRQPGHTVSPHSVWPGWHWSALLGEGSPAGRWVESERGRERGVGQRAPLPDQPVTSAS